MLDRGGEHVLVDVSAGGRDGVGMAIQRPFTLSRASALADVGALAFTALP
jgi:hypothetical protein